MPRSNRVEIERNQWLRVQRDIAGIELRSITYEKPHTRLDFKTQKCGDVVT